MQALPLQKKTVFAGRILFLLPVSIFFFFFFVYPFAFTVYTSFTSWRGIGGMKFNGLTNYKKLLLDPTFQKALGNNIIWALCQGFIQVPLACLVAMILVRKPKGWKLLRTVYYLPNVISTVA
ncbi:MAG TPA: sugar ABC transporter permease, partial [Sphaerochaeta sp.]|nr:sugar ABC transporter permease [Sphaerochaeta sp.]